MKTNAVRAGMGVAALALLATTGVAAVAVADGGSSGGGHGHKPRTLATNLSGFEEDPLVRSTPGHGQFRARVDAAKRTISYRLSYEGLESGVTQAHIHFGGRHQSGGISVFLCTNLGNSPSSPACPAGDGEVTGTLEAASVVGPADQGIAAGEFVELLRAIKGGVTYVNVHTTGYPGGEIRGQLGHGGH
jgi:hypothetical protein